MCEKRVDRLPPVSTLTGDRTCNLLVKGTTLQPAEQEYVLGDQSQGLVVGEEKQPCPPLTLSKSQTLPVPGAGQALGPAQSGDRQGPGSKDTGTREAEADRDGNEATSNTGTCLLTVWPLGRISGWVLCGHRQHPPHSPAWPWPAMVHSDMHPGAVPHAVL